MICGDGNIVGQEICDDGDANGTPNHCSATCTAPTIDSGALEILGAPAVGEMLTVSYTYVYEESAEGTSTYQRYRNGNAIS